MSLLPVALVCSLEQQTGAEEVRERARACSVDWQISGRPAVTTDSAPIRTGKGFSFSHRIMRVMNVHFYSFTFFRYIYTRVLTLEAQLSSQFL